MNHEQIAAAFDAGFRAGRALGMGAWQGSPDPADHEAQVQARVTAFTTYIRDLAIRDLARTTVWSYDQVAANVDGLMNVPGVTINLEQAVHLTRLGISPNVLAAVAATV